jgi:HlyD family secretion protein
MSRERKQSDRRWLWLGVAIILVVVFYSIRSLTRTHQPIRVARAEHQSLARTVSTNGRVEPEVNYQLHSPIATTVKAVYVQPGDRVPAGKVLMVLDDMQARARLAAAESGVKAAQASYDAVTHNGTQEQRQMALADLKRAQLDRNQASLDLNALIKLQSTGAASASEVAAARQRLEAAEASLHAAQQNVGSRYSTVDVERAKAALAEAEANLAAAHAVVAQTVVRAPISGTVYSMGANRSDFVEQGALLLQMADLSNERVRAYFDEPEIGLLAVGQPILIKWDAKPGEIWHGRIERTPITVVTYGTRRVGEALVKIDDKDGQLLPDTNVTVTVTTSKEPDVLSVPREALHSASGKSFVYRVVGDKLVKTPVVIGTFNLTQVAILSGLKDGDLVATGTTTGLPMQEGVPVEVVQ